MSKRDYYDPVTKSLMLRNLITDCSAQVLVRGSGLMEGADA
ncbi:MAG: hypothetical protein ACOX0Z_00295 [Candidatus Nanosyncoccaceae bacterium]|jgi:hypothetical protein